MPYDSVVGAWIILQYIIGRQLAPERYYAKKKGKEGRRKDMKTAAACGQDRTVFMPVDYAKSPPPGCPPCRNAKR